MWVVQTGITIVIAGSVDYFNSSAHMMILGYTEPDKSDDTSQDIF